MKNKNVFIELLQIFGNPKKDWMGYKISKENFLSFHHIIEERDGGMETIENGAILTKRSHRLLHMLEYFNYELYEKWQFLFIEINSTRQPINNYYYAKIAELKKETQEFCVLSNNPKLYDSTLLLHSKLR